MNIDALAAKKKASRSSNPRKGNGGGGFGKQPSSSSSSSLSLEELLLTFPTRQPSSPDLPCPCGTRPGGVKYQDCCQPLHQQTQLCTTPIDVLRSRYTAFAYRNIQHIMSTTHPSNRDWREDSIAWAKDLDRDGMFDSLEFVQLTILDSQEWQEQNEQKGGEEETDKEKDVNSSWIEFQVTLRGRNGDVNHTNKKGGAHRGGAMEQGPPVAGLETIIKERSRFLRNPATGVWTYAGGDVTSQVAGLEDSKLNP